MTAPRPGSYQVVWWWRWRSLWPPLRVRFLPVPDHGPACVATGSVYAWAGLRVGPLELRKWGRIRGDCNCARRGPGDVP